MMPLVNSPHEPSGAPSAGESAPSEPPAIVAVQWSVPDGGIAFVGSSTYQKLEISTRSPAGEVVIRGAIRVSGQSTATDGSRVGSSTVRMTAPVSVSTMSTPAVQPFAPSLTLQPTSAVRPSAQAALPTSAISIW